MPQITDFWFMRYIDKDFLLAEWYQKVTQKKRGYPHFDKNVSPKKIINLVTSPKRIISHQFFPLIWFEKKEQKYTKINERETARIKIRNLYYASHLDALIYSWYATILEYHYENHMADKEYRESVIAYRKLDHKSNIDFALEVFEEIESRETSVVITIDIQNFFESLDHQLIKSSWVEILKVPALPNDHYKIFRSITKYSPTF